MRASYRFGVRWIADNDEPDQRDLEEIAEQVSTLLLADLFDKDPYDVARAISRQRERDLIDRLEYEEATR